MGLFGEIVGGLASSAVDAAKKGMKQANETKQRATEDAAKLSDERLIRAVRNMSGSSMNDMIKRGAYIQELKNRGYTYDDVK